MRHVADEDKARLEQCVVLLRNRPVSQEQAREVCGFVLAVLVNMDSLEKPAPHQPPRIVQLSDAEMKKAYPERSER